ncbi:VP6(dBP) [Great Island virus]|uniref:VP6(DBP) n=1 Tax=Great Island virus TaxID=204269 RepID=E1AA98_9REOV|nr:VP6(dBP) [Great Island virus]ADM88601.1 VP6(dBP) [Great Island virus]
MSYRQEHVLRRLRQDRHGNLETARDLERPGWRWIQEQREALNVPARRARAEALTLTFGIRRVEATLPREILHLGMDFMLRGMDVPSEVVEILAILRNRAKVRREVIAWSLAARKRGLEFLLLPLHEYVTHCAKEDIRIYESSGLKSLFRIEIASCYLARPRLRSSELVRMRMLRRKTRRRSCVGTRCVQQ